MTCWVEGLHSCLGFYASSENHAVPVGNGSHSVRNGTYSVGNFVLLSNSNCFSILPFWLLLLFTLDFFISMLTSMSKEINVMLMVNISK